MTADKKYEFLDNFLTEFECFEDLKALNILINWTGTSDDVLDYFIQEMSEGEYTDFEEWVESL